MYYTETTLGLSSVSRPMHGPVARRGLQFPQRFPQQVAFRSWQKKRPRSGRKSIKTEVLRDFTLQLAGQERAAHSDGPRTAKKPYREHEDGAEEAENSVDGDSHKADGQRHQPDERIQHKSKQRQWPAQDEQDDPQEESSHGNLAYGGRKTASVKSDRGTAPLPSILTESAWKRFLHGILL